MVVVDLTPVSVSLEMKPQLKDVVVELTSSDNTIAVETKNKQRQLDPNNACIN